MATVTKRTWTTGKGEKREAWVLAYTDKKGDRHKEQFAKKREADAERVKVEGQISKGAFRAEAASKTVKDAIDAYVKHLEKRHGKGEQVTTMYLRNTKGQLVTHAQPELGDTKLAELTARAVNDLVEKLRDAEVGLVTVRRVIGSLSRALQYAVGQDWVATNAAKGVRVIGKRGQGSEKVVPPSKKALADILESGDSDMKRRIQFAAATGLRASEQWAVRWRHIDLKARTVKVEERVDAFGEFDTTKSESGQRIVPLGKTIVSTLRSWKAETTHNGADDFVFPDTGGGFTRHTNFLRRQWKPLIEAAKVKDIGWHALRHFAVSTWIEAGLQPKAVQTLAGHASYAITMDRYGHLFPSDDHAAAMDKIAKALFSK
ncbi:site-specific integrase [Mesorhizobium sp. M1004]|uniref:tyrosine-type recombinase/integrase n=1 Tax=Mesorhizobium sp. M1004 TaxID=2957046 RepID=UPI00333888E4